MLNLYLVNVENSLSKFAGATRRSLRKIWTNSENTLKKKQLEESQCSKTLRRAEAFCSKLKNPSFIREMKPSYVQHDLLVILCMFGGLYSTCFSTHIS